MAFVTDLLWRSPLGLRINAQATADVLMTEDWVKVRGDQLAPRDGAYDLRDHRGAVGDALLRSRLAAGRRSSRRHRGLRGRALRGAAAAAATSSPPGRCSRSPRVRDDRGRDVSELAARRDGRYRRLRRPRRVSGHHARRTSSRWSCPTTAPRTGPLWLVAQGWIHPTDSSINVAIGQGSHDAPEGLSLQVADASGRFRDGARPASASRRARTRRSSSISTGLFGASGPRRLRLATNLEIFWDRLAWAVGRPDVAIAPRRLELADGGSRATAGTRSPNSRRPSVAGAPALRARGHRRRGGAISRATTRGSATSASCCARWTTATSS